MWQLRKVVSQWKSPLSRLIRSNKRYFSSEDKRIEDENITCLTLHPVTWPNHGPQIELYLAEEAIGLVKSLDWNVAKGPMWSKGDNQNQESEQSTDEELEDEPKYTTNKKNTGLSHKRNFEQMRKEGIKDGDYVYGPEIEGVYYHQKGGVILEFDDDEKSYDLYDEWKNELLRESFAKNSLIKIRKIHSGTFLTKGKINDLGFFLKEKQDINVVFINSTLTSLQQKNLEKRWNDIIMNREERLRKYFLRSAQREKYEPTDIDSDTQLSEVEKPENEENNFQRKIKVVDRFGIILQIFALRAKTRIAQLQIELAWLHYARTMLVRGGAATFGQIANIFQGNLLKLDVQQVEIKSAKGRKSGSSGTIGGGGETQLELERRRLTDKEAKIHKEIEEYNKRSQHEKSKIENQHQTLPVVALVGYTNAGKTALMNLSTGSKLESEDMLFQTLNTSHRRFRMPTGQMALMLDTVGFITNLPHGLVKSFKATLEEIHFADILVHVRDISHPNTNYQRDTVLKVLKEIGIPEDKFSKKYIEVWNKIDLIKDKEQFYDNLRAELSQAQQLYPVVLTSCTEGTNHNVFMDEISKLSQTLMGKKYYQLSYDYKNHNKINAWLFKAANISQVDDLEFNEEDQKITINKYLKEFQEEQFIEQKEKKKNRLTPPPGWNN